KDRSEFARESQTSQRGGRPEPAPAARGEEVREQQEHTRRAGDERHLHRDERAVRQQVRAEREEPRGEGHPARAMLPTRPEGRQEQPGGPDPERPESQGRQEHSLPPFRIIDEPARTEPVQYPLGRSLLDLPERQRRAHPGDTILPTLAPPLPANSQIR